MYEYIYIHASIYMHTHTCMYLHTRMYDPPACTHVYIAKIIILLPLEDEIEVLVVQSIRKIKKSLRSQNMKNYGYMSK